VSDVVFLVPGWENSKGTAMEIERAKELGIPIVRTFEVLMGYETIRKHKVCGKAGTQPKYFPNEKRVGYNDGA
jgi:hypothetical protein